MIAEAFAGDEFPHPLCNPLLGYGLDVRTAPLITNQKISFFLVTLFGGLSCFMHCLDDLH